MSDKQMLNSLPYSTLTVEICLENSCGYACLELDNDIENPEISAEQIGKTVIEAALNFKKHHEEVYSSLTADVNELLLDVNIILKFRHTI